MRDVWWNLIKSDVLFFNYLMLFWTLDVKFKSFYRIRWVTMNVSLVFSSGIIVHLFSTFKLMPSSDSDGWIWAKKPRSADHKITPLFMEQYVWYWMLHWHNWHRDQVVSFTSLRQHKNKHFEKKPRRFITKPGFTFMLMSLIAECDFVAAFLWNYKRLLL